MRDTILEKLAKRSFVKKDDDESRLTREINKSLYLIRSKVMRPKSISSARGGLISMGARGPYIKNSGIYDRRVIVKASYIKSDNKNARARIGHHLHYAAMNKNEAFEKSSELYSADDNEVCIQDKLDSFAKAPHFFNIIISPEDGDKVNLKEFTRDFVKTMEEDLRTKLEWTAGNHYDTNDPHVHVLIKGQDDRDEKLLMKPDYISRGLRVRASQIMTSKLGLRDQQEVTQSLLLDANKTKKSILDDVIKDCSPNSIINMAQVDSEDLQELPKKLIIQRLELLQSKNLATKLDESRWELKENFQKELSDIHRMSSLIERVSGKLAVDKKACEIISAKNLNERVINGHVLERGLVENSDSREYLLVKSKEKKFVYVELEKFSEKSPAVVGEFVQVETTKPFVGPKASDHTIAAQARGFSKIYDPKEHEKALEGSSKLPPGVNPKEFVDMHLKRLELLARKGIVEKLDNGRFKIGLSYLKKISAEATKSKENYKPHIKVMRLSPGRLKSPKINRGRSL